MHISEEATKMGRFIVLFMASCSLSWSATCPASTFAQLQSCVTNAAAGDTVQVSASMNWTASITATTGITIQGVGSPTMTLNGNRLVLYPSAPATTLMRVTGLTFSGAGGGLNSSMEVDGQYAAFGDGSLLRIDHNTFTPGAAKHAITIGWNTWINISPCTPIYGLVDNNTFNNTNAPPNNATSILLYGCNESWLSDTNLGTAQFLFLEQNTFNCNVSWSPDSDVLDADYGGRWVFRNNTVTNCSVMGHDVGSLNESAGQRAWEMYNNNFFSTGNLIQFEYATFRGGTGVWHHNNFEINGTTHGANVLAATEIQRLHCSGNAPFGIGCSVTGVGCMQTSRRVCSTLRSYCAPGSPKARQTCNTYNNGDAFCGGGPGSCMATCTSDNQCPVGSVCLSNGMGGGLDGPAASLASGYPCRNQSGAGKNILGNNSLQTLDPMYSWLNCNTVAATAAPCPSGAPVTGAFEVNVDPSEVNYIQADREYFGWNTRPGTTQNSGTAVGVLSARPNCGKAGVGYWATDTNTLYTCTATGTPGTWVPKYQTYTNPHPLQGGGGATKPAAPTLLTGTAH